MANQRSHLISCFSAVFPELSGEEILLASVASVADWDSLATINLLTLIEEEFGIEVAPDDLASLESFELVLDYLGLHAGDT